MNFLLWCGILLSMICSAHSSYIASLRGGYVTWRPGNDPYEVLIDYKVFFALDSTEGRQCTQQAINNRQLLHSSKSINKWIARNYDKMRRPQRIGKVKFYCTHRDTDNNRVIGELKGLRYKSQDAYYYIGFDGCCLDTAIKNRMFGDLKFGTLIDLTPRIDLNSSINHSPQPLVLPHYKVIEDDDQKFKINAVDDDNDFVKCKFVGDARKFNENTFDLEDCLLTIASFTRPGKYIIAIAVEDYQNRDSKQRFSSVTVVFEIEKLPVQAIVPTIPRFQPLRSLACNRLRVGNTWQRDLVVLKDNEQQITEVHVHSTSYQSSLQIDNIDDSRDGSIYKIRWTPKEEHIGKHLVCFVAVNQQRIHSKQRCWYLEVRTDTKRPLESEFIYPKPGGLAPPDLSSFEIKVYGAFERPLASSFLKIYRSEDNFLEYQIDLSDPNTSSYVINQMNHVIIKPNQVRRLTPNKQYYLEIDHLGNPQHPCTHVPTTSISRGQSFTVTDAPEAVKFQLQCYHNRMTFYLNPRFLQSTKNTTKVYIGDNKNCQMTYIEKRNLYYAQILYEECGTQSREKSRRILFTNTAEIHLEEFASGDALISREETISVNLQCEMRREYLNSIKGKLDTSTDGTGTTGTVKEVEEFEIKDIASNSAAFPITFQVFHSLTYVKSYGTEEFPIYVSLRGRIYFELDLEAHEELKLVPHQCYATKTRNPDETVKHYIIKDRCQADETYAQHMNENTTFRFSVQAFTFKNNRNNIFVHCRTNVCKNDSLVECRFGCQEKDKRRRARRSTEENSVEEIVTSTFEIRIGNSGSYRGELNTNQLMASPSVASKSTSTYLYFIQIPIIIVVAIVLIFLWKRFKIKQHISRKEPVEETFL